MMRTPDTLPLQIMLAMMQAGLMPNVSTPWSASWPGFMPGWMRSKTPLEKSVDQATEWAQNLQNQLNDQWTQFGAMFEPPPEKKPWEKRKEAREEARPQKNSTSSRRMPGSPTTDSTQGDPGICRDENPFTEFLHPDFLEAINGEAFKRSTGFLQGVQAYLTSDYTRPEKNYPVLWSQGSAQLFDLAPERRDALAVLCIPSLINRSTILDLYPDASFIEYLKSQGFRPLLLDWGTPTDEADFAAADYITARAIPALQSLREAHDGPIALLGYCMGGIFATAMAQLAPLFVDALILLATPWDFSSPDTPRVLIDAPTQLMLRQWIGGMNPVPPLITQSIFQMIDPWRVQEKYSRYPDLTDDEKIHFLAVEEWVNAGVPLAQKLAEECFVDWPHGNILANHQWKVGRRWIEPSTITCPTLAVIPTKDLIVPAGCAMPLAEAIPRCDILKPEAGHVSMVVGRNAKAALWKPLTLWLNEKFYFPR
jgi:polyhydroxyalkanoate synthase